MTTSRAIQPDKDSMKSTMLFGLGTENSQSCLGMDSCETENKLVTNETVKDMDNSDDDFVSIKPLRKRRRVLEDDNSNSAHACDIAIPVPTVSTDLSSSADAKTYPLVHSLGLESLMSTSCMCIADMLSQGLKVS